MNLYIHVPFCHAKCGYCAFYSEVNASSAIVDAWLKKMLLELAHLHVLKTPIETLFVGGGTPTSLPLPQFKKLFIALSQLKKSDHYEFSVECNPESLTLDKVKVMEEYGVTRLSIGVQTLSLPLRTILQRKGNVETLLPLIQQIRKLGFKSLNADLIYAIPTQSINDARQDVVTLLGEGIDHLSCYSLTPEEGSLLYEDFSSYDSEVVSAKIAASIPQWIAPYGLRRYEISNYSKPNHECRHNLNIWLGAQYIGLGPAAASYNGVTRSIEVSNVFNWLKKAPPEIDIISPQQRANEVFAFGLRTVQGWSQDDCLRATGQKTDAWAEILHPFLAQNYVEFHEDGRLNLTDRGLMFWDTIAQEII